MSDSSDATPTPPTSATPAGSGASAKKPRTTAAKTAAPKTGAAKTTAPKTAAPKASTAKAAASSAPTSTTPAAPKPAPTAAPTPPPAAPVVAAPVAAAPPKPPLEPRYAGPMEPFSPSDEKMWAVLTHIGGLLAGFVAPLVAYLAMRERGPLIRRHAVTALNFQLTVLIAYFVASILTLVFIGFLLYLVVWAGAIVLSIMAAQAAHRGEDYKYPLAIPFLS